jgi:hypothetical protein
MVGLGGVLCLVALRRALLLLHRCTGTRAATAQGLCDPARRSFGRASPVRKMWGNAGTRLRLRHPSFLIPHFLRASSLRAKGSHKPCAVAARLWFAWGFVRVHSLLDVLCGSQLPSAHSPYRYQLRSCKFNDLLACSLVDLKNRTTRSPEASARQPACIRTLQHPKSTNTRARAWAVPVRPNKDCGLEARRNLGSETTGV